MEEYIKIPGPDGPIFKKLSDLLEEHKNDRDPAVQKKSAMARKTIAESGFPPEAIDFLNSRKKDK